ncbi:hypothetical protein BKA69DRAFT_1104913 [Paraphysoderma sedebokerense]|nr:hypothetical protein BKA69DRAFT_1104913 [Paraphysoderma sedebokerense]
MSSSQMDRELYFKLQNIEDHQDILPKAELELQNRLDTARQYLKTEFKTPQLSNLVDEYSEELIEKWHDQSYFDVLEKYNKWLTTWESNGRKNEMLVSEEFTKWWLTQIAPTKLVDGSWLQNVASGKSMKDSRTLRPVLANLYLTFFEELGEGHLNRNHVTVYRETLETAGINLPLSTSRAFAESSALYDESFFVGTTQLLLGTFSDKYLPEIIGYNFGYI